MLKVFDAHFHIIDPRFPLIENQSYLPEPFTLEEYQKQTAFFELIGGALVSGSFQGFDQTYLLEALRRLGPRFVGVTQLPVNVADEEIVRLNEAGVRAIRFNLKRGGSERVEVLERMAKRVYELAGWHCELYVDSTELDVLSPLLVSLPAVSIDHLGLSERGFPTLLRLVEKGIKVKATGFGRIDFDVGRALRQIVAIDPTALLFGTDLPSTRAPRPFLKADIDLITSLFDQSLAEQILYKNALQFYKPASMVI